LRIDSSHKKWIVGSGAAGVAAVALYIWLDAVTPGGLTGGSQVGLIYALVGSALMIFAGLLAAHRKLLRWNWVPRRAWWLKGHIWLGLLSGVIIYCHSGFGWGGTFEHVLWAVFALTLATGVIGVFLQHYLPGRLSAGSAEEVPYEQIPHLCRQLLRRGDALVSSVCGVTADDANDPPGSQSLTPRLGAGDSRLSAADRQQFRDFYESQIRPFLHETYDPVLNPMEAMQSFGLATVREQMDELRNLCDERRKLGERERLYHWLHGWLVLHVPLSVALLIFGVTHAVVALYY
jgi:hypothetical protein